MKNSADLGGCYPPRPPASVDNTLLDLQNSSYPTQPHSIIAKYMRYVPSKSIYLVARLARQWILQRSEQTKKLARSVDD